MVGTLLPGAACVPSHGAGSAGISKVIAGYDRDQLIAKVGSADGNIVNACLLHSFVDYVYSVVAVSSELVRELVVFCFISVYKVLNGFIGAVDIERRDVADEVGNGGIDLVVDTVEAVAAEENGVRALCDSSLCNKAGFGVVERKEDNVAVLKSFYLRGMKSFLFSAS